MQASFWETVSCKTHTYKDDCVPLIPAVRFVFGKLGDQAFVALQTVLLQHSAFERALFPEPTAPDTLQCWTVRRRDLLQLCWVICHVTDFCDLLTSPEQLRRDVVSRLYSKYGGDPMWLMSLSGWTFPDLPDVEPSLLGLVNLYEDDSLHRFRVSDSTDGEPFYINREDAHQLMEGVVDRIEHSPKQVISAIDHQCSATFTRKQAWKMARAIGKDKESKIRLAAALQSSD